MFCGHVPGDEALVSESLSVLSGAAGEKIHIP